MGEIDDAAAWKALVTSDRVDYEADPIKHYVRSRGWRHPCRMRANKVKRRPVRYFTFCASGAIDVFMLEHAGVLSRDPDGHLEATYFCEQDAETFQAIATLVQTREEGFLGRFEDIILFKESQDTIGRTLDDPGPEEVSVDLRRRLLLKDLHERLRASFPFDIINLDATGTLLPPKQGPVSRLVEAIIQILEWQSLSREGGIKIDAFTLLLTAEVDNSAENDHAITQLVELVKANLSQTEGFRQRWIQEYGDKEPGDVAKAEFPIFFSRAVPKMLVEKAFQLGWHTESEGRFLYRRARARTGDSYTMMCEVLTFKRLPSASRDSLYNPSEGLSSTRRLTRVAESIVDVTWREPVWADQAVADPRVREAVEEDLRKVLDFRGRRRAGLGTSE